MLDLKLPNESKFEPTFLRINIEGRWNIIQVVELLRALNCIYQFFVASSIYDKTDTLRKYISKSWKDDFKKATGYSWLTYVRYSAKKSVLIDNDIYFKYDWSFKKERFEEKYEYNIDSLNLILKEFKYSSPGSLDLIGLGKVLEQIFSLVKHYFPNKESKTRVKLLDEELLAKKIKNMKDIGIPDSEIKKMYLAASNGEKTLAKYITKSYLISSVEINKQGLSEVEVTSR